MLAQEKLPPSREGDGGLEVPSGRQQRRRFDGQLDPDRSQASADPHGHGPAADHPHHAVIGVAEDPAIVQEKGIGDAPQLGAGDVVVHRHRLVGGIAAGGDQRRADRLDQGPVQGRVGEEGAQRAQPGRHRAGQRGAFAAPEQHDRRGRAAQGQTRCLVHLGVRGKRGQITKEHGERFAIAPLAIAQALDDLGRGRVAEQVEPADSLDGEDLARAK